MRASIGVDPAGLYSMTLLPLTPVHSFTSLRNTHSTITGTIKKTKSFRASTLPLSGREAD